MRYLMTFSYDGTDYSGYQKQPNKNTVQDNLESNLSKIFNTKILISASGRTEKGVHAINQKAHFDAKEIDINKLKNSLNKLINEDIYIKDIKKVKDDFHARFNVKEKEYIYLINLGEYNPIDRNYIHQYNKELDIKKMEKASKYLIGKHNFKSLTKASKDIESYERTIYSIKITKKKDILEIAFKGDGFLRYMVRNMVGLLIEIGSNKREIKSVKSILEAENRVAAGITAPACGLYLKNVKY